MQRAIFIQQRKEKQRPSPDIRGWAFLRRRRDVVSALVYFDQVV
jgi:hypothetical protein